MKRSIKIALLTLTLSVLLMGSTLPAFAQFDQDDTDRAQCFVININAADWGGVGQYIFLFFYQDQVFQTYSIEYAEPNENLSFNVVVPPQTEVQVYTPVGAAYAFILPSGYGYYGSAGDASIYVGDMGPECLGHATDGRINKGDTHMLAAIYNDGDGGYDIWWINDELDGNFDYNVTRAEIDAALASANASGQAQLLGSGMTSSFYALPDNQCVLESPTSQGDPQSFVFTCGA